jgi:hypothetical protein
MLVDCGESAADIENSNLFSGSISIFCVAPFEENVLLTGNHASTISQMHRPETMLIRSAKVAVPVLILSVAQTEINN